MNEIDKPDGDVMSYRSLAVYLELAPNTLRHKVMRGEIPFYKIGGAVRFSKIKIDEWLQKHHRERKHRPAKPVEVREGKNEDGSLFAKDEGGEK